ncbi:MAG: acyltransferase family protein [Myxococcaceae bacterium]|nr:MAG: acyltransferase family protein [Myxococcaceae bacterium]
MSARRGGSLQGSSARTEFRPWLAAVDHFDASRMEALVGYDEGRAERFYAQVARVADQLGATVRGVERLPPGRGLLVANHAFGWDSAFAIALVRRATGRRIWVLGEHLWWDLPYVRGLAAAVGVVDGTRANVDRLLQADELVLVMPGGLREALKPRELRYRLLWGHHYGFVRAALRSRAPLVPLASFGADEWFDWVGDPYERGRRWLLPLGIHLPLPRPWAGLPRVHRVRPEYVFGEPVMPTAGPEAEDDPATLRHLRREIEGALHELIEDELARRAGFAQG